MTTTTRPPTTSRSIRATISLAALSGAALVVDTVTIAVINRSFDPLDSVLFLVGFVGMLLTVGAISIHFSRHRHGPARVMTAMGSYLAIAAGLGGLSFAFDQLGRHLFSASNKGLHGEWSFFSIGVALLLVAWGAHRQSTSDRQGRRTVVV